MTILRNLIVAFSLYSRVPVPIFEWKESDLKYNLVFLPWVGAVIGGLECIAWRLMQSLALPVAVQTMLLSALPILLTGGFHLDGFMDMQDALNSYKPREEKLKILKDPHIGAFAVISLLAYCLLWGAGLYTLLNEANSKWVACFALLFPLVRALAGLTSLLFPHARKDGMLNNETGSSGSESVAALALETALFLGATCVVCPAQSVMTAVCLALFTLVYFRRCTKQLGGVTGDTTGWFVAVGELVCLLLTATGGLLWK